MSYYFDHLLSLFTSIGFQFEKSLLAFMTPCWKRNVVSLVSWSHTLCSDQQLLKIPYWVWSAFP